MKRRPVILDLFACAGGAGEGYRRAGFDVLGVDRDPQPRNPHPTLVADVMALPVEFIRLFDAVHASPPCQGYTDLRHAPGTIGAPKLIGPVRDLLIAAGVPWVIENVDSKAARAELRQPVLLCGTAFGLGAEGHQLQRHRLFETSFPLLHPGCRHDATKPVVGVYGGHARCRAARFGGRGTVDFAGRPQRAIAAEAMGIDWMTLAEMSEALPPAYTEYVGRELLTHLQSPA